MIYDGREGSKTRGVVQEFVIGEDDYSLVCIPPLVWNAFKGISATPSIVANCATIPHDPDEIVRKDPYTKEIPYEWR